MPGKVRIVTNKRLLGSIVYNSNGTEEFLSQQKETANSDSKTLFNSVKANNITQNSLVVANKLAASSSSKEAEPAIINN